MKRALLVALLMFGAPNLAHADIGDWTEVPTHPPSPENFGLELRFGSYYLNDSSFGMTFGGDIGPMLGLEFHYFPLRIDYLGLIGAGIGLGWSKWSGNAVAAGGGGATERTSFEIVPINFNIDWRFDTLARLLEIPLIIEPKIGVDVVYWSTGTGGTSDGSGWSVGPRFAGKVALELDFLDRRAARRLDDEWGVNHSELFFELYYSMAGDIGNSMFPVAGWGWALGIGITF
jgi:hypothetical protein